jgi:hypothetical protein
MANGPVITFAAAIFERDHLLVLALLDDFAGNGRAFDQRAAMGELVAIAMEKDIAENGLLPRVAFEKIDIDDVALRDAMLSAACFDNCVSHNEKELWGKAAQIHTDAPV